MATIFIVAIFVYINKQIVTLNYYHGKINLSLGKLIIISVIFGSLITLIPLSLKILRLKYIINQQNMLHLKEKHKIAKFEANSGKI
jgi:uncharacterized integral membrane protein